MKDNELNLATLVDDVVQSIDLEKQEEIKKKINHVFRQKAIFEDQLKRNENERKKLEERYKKASDKIVELRKGNKSVLDSINPNEEQKKEE